MRTLPANGQPQDIGPRRFQPVTEEAVPASSTETVAVDLTGLAPGHYTLRASVEWQQHKPGATHAVNYAPMTLARDGRDGSGLYPIATLDIPRDTQMPAHGQ